MLKNRWTLELAGLWLCIFSSAVLADNSPFIVDSWNRKEGLPQSSVFSIIQTRDGYLWLGTFNGLVRFDGNRFTVFDPNNLPDLDSGRITCLFEDSRTNLWIGTDTANVALVRDGRIRNFQIGRSGHEGRLISVCEDASGAVWFYTADAHLGCYRDGKLEVLNFNFPPLVICRMIAAEKNGPLWIAEFSVMPSGLPFSKLFAIQPQGFHPPAVVLKENIPAQRLDFILASRREGTWRLIDGHIKKWNATGLEKDFGAFPWTNATVTSACEDQDGNLIVGTVGAGVFWFDADGNYRHITGELSSPDVLSLCMDRDGNLWVGTDGGGLNRVKRKNFQMPEETRADVVQSVSEDSQGGLWMAFNGTGASYWITNSAQDFATIGRYQNAWTVLVDDKQQVWVGTRDEGLFQFQANRFQRATGSQILNGQIFALFEDHGRQLWVGAQNGLARWDGKNWKLFTTNDGLSENIVRAIAEDHDGNLWVGTESSGLNLLKDGKFISYRKQNGLPGDDVSSLCVDRSGSLWVGTFFHGLARFQNGKWISFSTSDGLASDSIDYILEDGDDLWIGSNEGLTRIQKKSVDSLSCRTFTETDGLLTRECSAGSQPAAIRAHDGRLFFPTTKGLVSVNPAELKTNSQPPLVMIESVRIDDREQKTNRLDSAWAQSIVIPPGYEQLEIDYTALNFSAPDAVRFRCWLEGHETAPVDVGGERVARYPKLPPGNYRFHVNAENEDGIWSKNGGVLEMTVQPWFWQTGWFRAAVIIFAFVMVAAIVRFISTQKLRREVQSLKQQEALEKERGRIARDLHDQLGANLTQVALLGEMAEADKNSPAEIESHAQQISQTARETTRSLDEIVWAVNPSNDTLEGLANYACKYAQEYLALARLRYRLDVPTELPTTPIPPPVRHNVFLAFKEAVNNVVKHAQASEVWIRLHLSPEHFTLEIEDNGRGVGDQAVSQNRNGLRNMKKRMDDIRGEFSISGGKNGGTIVRLTVPII